MPADLKNGLNISEASSVVAVGCALMAEGLAGAVGQGATEDGAYFVEILSPDGGQPMFFVGKERGRYVVRGQDGGRLADGRTLDALFVPMKGALPRYSPRDNREAAPHGAFTRSN